ncbi:MAG: FAS1-like dehydratase domain-containing protein [Egibacteraceae bacterium]
MGHVYPSYRYEVSREKVREYALATGVTDPACSAETGDVVAPPTFAACFTVTRGGGGMFADPELGAHPNLVHGSQSYAFHRPVRVGDVLECRPRIADIQVRGRMDLLTLEIECVNADGGEPVVTSRGTIIFFNSDPPATAPPSPSPADPHPPATAPPSRSPGRAERMPRLHEVEVGTRIPPVQQTLDQAQLIAYAGASGDLNPLHWEPEFAARVSPTGRIIAHGMLNMGIVSRVVTEWAGGPEKVASLEASFRAPCPVGATVTFGGEVIELDEAGRTATVAVWAELDDGSKVVDRRSSRAVVRLE